MGPLPEMATHDTALVRGQHRMNWRLWGMIRAIGSFPRSREHASFATLLHSAANMLGTLPS